MLTVAGGSSGSVKGTSFRERTSVVHRNDPGYAAFTAQHAAKLMGIPMREFVVPFVLLVGAHVVLIGIALQMYAVGQ